MSDHLTTASTLYLGISGVLHPSDSFYSLMHGRSPWEDGHSKYECAPVLVQALESWPDVEIILTSTQPWAHGFESVLELLGPTLAARVVGHTHEDLTTKVKREVNTRNGLKRTVGISNEDYWRMNKSAIVATHVKWRRPDHWIVVDDEDILWPHDVRRDRLVLTDGCVGLQSAEGQDRLRTVMHMNFGQGTK
ncbi:MAG: HAD domain-containing protein [Pseudomonadota bacterium]